MITNILQTKAWEKFLNDEGDQTYRLEDKGYIAMCVLKSTPVGNYLFLPYGPSLESGKDLKPALTAVKKLAKEKGAIFIRIEPTIELSEKTIKDNELKKSKDIDPRSTVILDLTQSEEDILKNMEKKKRKVYRNYKEKGISIRQSSEPKEVKILLDFYSTLTQKRGFNPHSNEYLGKQINYDFTKLYIAELEGKPIGAAMIYDDDYARYYAYAADSEEHKNLSTSVALVTQMIFDAKADGKKVFDFWGATTSNDPNDPWYGFTQYKLSYGGQIKTYAGTYDIVLNKGKYSLYSALRKVNRIKRKLIK